MALAAKASYKTEVAWGQQTGGLFTFGTSQFGGVDLLAAASWSQAFAGADADLTYQPSDGSYVDSFTVTRGRSDDLAAMQAGVADINLKDPSARYNRENTASPLYGLLDAVRPLRISATFGGVTYPIYYGFIDRIDWQPSPGGRGGDATIHCVDFFSWLDQRKPTIVAAGQITTGAVLAALLDDIRWTDPALRNLAVGDTLPYFAADGSRSSLEIAEDLLTGERGAVYVAASGAVTYHDRHYAYGLSPVATITDVMSGFATGADRTAVRNQWTVTRSGGVPQVASDLASQHLYGYFDDSLETQYLRDDNQALALAQWLVLLQKTPVSRVWEVKLRNTTDAMLTQILARDLYDLVTLNAARVGTGGDYLIQQVVHRVSLGGSMHEVTWRAEKPVTAQPFKFGVSTFGGTDVLIY